MDLVNMRIARPAYKRFLAVKAQLRQELGREVTNNETWEALLRCWEQTRALLDDVRQP